MGAALARLGRYELVRHLARGGMADVLLARTSGTFGFERYFVLKRIRHEQAYDELHVAMFLDEARLAASLHHHNIVQVTDIGEDHGEYFFTMEYVHGEDARALLAKVSRLGEHVPLEHVLSIACAAAAGLHHAHEQRSPDRKLLEIVHRDVSPANILIGYDGGVKVADFGIAKSRRTTETATGTLKGKVAYMSPEQAVGEAVDRRSDVFSLGIVLYELLTVRRLFKGENDFLTMTAIVLGYIPPASELRRDLPPEIEAILMKALANKPGDRFATADEMRLALEQAAAKLQLSMSSTGLADYMKRVFGERPLPWLRDENDPPAAVIDDDDPDFDGSLRGVARAPTEDIAPSRRRSVTDLPDFAEAHMPELPAVLVEPFDEIPTSPSDVVLLTRPATEVVLLVPKPSNVALLTAAHAIEPRAETEIPPLHVGRTFLAFAAVIAIAVAIYIARTVDVPLDDMRMVDLPTESVPVARPTAAPAIPIEAPAEKKPKKPRPVPKREKPWDPDSLFPE